MNPTREPESHPLQPIQYRDIYREDDVPLCNVRESALRHVNYIGVILLIVFLILGAVTPMSRTIRSRFEVKNIQPEQVVRFFDDVYVQKVHVKAGDAVEAGTPLLQITSSQIVSLISAQRDAEQELQRFHDYQTPLYQAEVEALRLQQAQNSAKLDRVRQQVSQNVLIYQAKTGQFQVKMADSRKNFIRSQSLFARDLISSQQLTDAEVSFETAHLDSIIYEREYGKQQTDLAKELETLSYANDVLVQNIHEKEHQQANDESQLQQKKAQTANKIRQLYGLTTIDDNALTLQAEAPGAISFLIEQHEGTIAEQTTILRVQPVAVAGFRIISTVAAMDIGRVEVGVPVKLQFDAFPRTQFGYLEGEITSLSRTSDKDGKYPFEGALTVRPDSKIRVQASLTGVCYIRADEGVFFAFMFDRVKRLVLDRLE